MVADGGLDEARGLEAGEAVLGLALEMRVADEHRLSISSTPLKTSSAVMSFAFLLPTSSPKRADALGQRGAEARFVGAAVGRRDGVAVIAFAAVAE